MYFSELIIETVILHTIIGEGKTLAWVNFHEEKNLNIRIYAEFKIIKSLTK